MTHDGEFICRDILKKNGFTVQVIFLTYCNFSFFFSFMVKITVLLPCSIQNIVFVNITAVLTTDENKHSMSIVFFSDSFYLLPYYHICYLKHEINEDKGTLTIYHKHFNVTLDGLIIQITCTRSMDKIQDCR